MEKRGRETERKVGKRTFGTMQNIDRSTREKGSETGTEGKRERGTI